MANPFTNGNGGLPSTQLRGEDTPSGLAFYNRSAPWIATITGGDYGIPVGGGVVKDGSGLTVPTAAFVFVSVEAGDVRLRRDGTAPNATQGILLQAGFLGELETGASKAWLQVVAAASSPVATAFVNFEYRRYL